MRMGGEIVSQRRTIGSMSPGRAIPRQGALRQSPRPFHAARLFHHVRAACVNSVFASQFPSFPGGFELPVPSLKDLLRPSFQLILRRHVAYCAVQAYGIVPSDVTRYQPPRIRRRKGCAGRMHSRLSVPCRRSILPLLRANAAAPCSKNSFCNL